MEQASIGRLIDQAVGEAEMGHDHLRVTLDQISRKVDILVVHELVSKAAEIADRRNSKALEDAEG